jgi:hypothetical protein
MNFSSFFFFFFFLRSWLIIVECSCNRALKFAKNSGIEMKLWPSAENLVDGDERGVLGLVHFGNLENLENLIQFSPTYHHL